MTERNSKENKNKMITHVSGENNNKKRNIPPLFSFLSSAEKQSSQRNQSKHVGMFRYLQWQPRTVQFVLTHCSVAFYLYCVAFSSRIK